MNENKENDIAEALAEFLNKYEGTGDGKIAQAVSLQVTRKDGAKGSVMCLVLADSEEDSRLALEQIQYGPRDEEGMNALERSMSVFADGWAKKNGL